MQKNKFKSEKGSMTIYAIATILSFLMILGGIFFTSSVVRKNQLRTLIKIKEVYASQMQKAEEITEELKLKQPVEFNYTGAVQEWTVPATGNYRLEVWGAQGGGNYGGQGGYSKGIANLKEGIVLYAYIGEQGTASTETGGGFNGGGNPTNNSFYGGGGATDFRIKEYTLYHRIIVAGGGGARDSYAGSAGGGTNSCEATNTGDYCMATYATQISGGTSIANGGQSQYGKYLTNGTFGMGGSWIPSAGTLNGFAGGGGGWYGGGAGHYSTGGSGWIYTLDTFNAWKEGNETDALNYKLDETYYLTDAETKAGNDSTIPTHDGTSTMTGNSGNGYAKITWVGF